MSSVVNLSLFSRHGLTCLTPASHLSTAPGNIRICTQLNRRCIHRSSTHWTSVGSTSSSDTTSYLPHPPSTGFKIRKILHDTNPQSVKDQPNNDLTRRLAAFSENGRDFTVSDSMEAARYQSSKQGSQGIFRRREQVVVQERSMRPNVKMNELQNDLLSHPTRLRTVSGHAYRKADTSKLGENLRKRTWAELPTQQRSAWSARSRPMIVRPLGRISARSDPSDWRSFSSEEQDTSRKEILETLDTDPIVAVPLNFDQAVAGHKGSSSLQSRARGRSCLVTGATSGIGYEVAKGLALEGATHIRIISRDLARGQEALRKIKEEAGRADLHTDVLCMDITKLPLTELQKVFKPASGEWPPVDTVVLCAGVSQSKLAIQTSSEHVRQILDVNLMSNIMLSGTFLTAYHKTSRPRDIQKKTSGVNEIESSTINAMHSFCLVSISSLLAHKGGYGAGVYAASKSGLIAYNRALTVEAGAIYKRKSESWPKVPSFRVNTVSPGYIDTPMTEGIKGEGKESLTDKIPLGRFGKAEEVADAVLFLIGNEYANNCEISLDGGLGAT